MKRFVRPIATVLGGVWCSLALGATTHLTARAAAVEARAPLSFAAKVQVNEHDTPIDYPDALPKHEPALEAQTVLILETADDYIGAPYVWGGTKPGGFDCSGFVQYVYRRHGIELPRTSREMFAVGDDVRVLQPGDLVFFRTMGAVTSHVGIYIGDNRFISATTSYGVHVASLSSTYWGPKYVGAKRVF